MRLTTPTRALLCAATAAVLIATLRPDFSREAQSWANCIVCGELGTADALINLILFAPLGMGLALAGLPLRRAILAGTLLSALVELAQTVIPGRDPSLGDVLFNTAGTAVGFVLPRWASRLARLPDAAAARLSLGFAVLFAFVVIGMGMLLEPSLPRATYYGQWTPHLGHLEWYRGLVRSSAVGDLPIRPGRIEQSGRARALLLEGAPIVVDALAGPRVPALGSLFSIYDVREREIVLVGPDRDDLVFRYRMRAVGWRLAEPDVRLRGAMRGLHIGDALHVTVRRSRHDRLCITVNDHADCNLGIPVGRGWALLHYVGSFPQWLMALLDWAWVAILAAPVGFWARRNWQAGIAAATLASALWVLPTPLGLEPAGPGTGCAVALGAAVAAWVGNRFSHRPADSTN